MRETCINNIWENKRLPETIKPNEAIIRGVVPLFTSVVLLERRNETEVKIIHIIIFQDVSRCLNH